LRLNPDAIGPPPQFVAANIEWVAAEVEPHDPSPVGRVLGK
jgi:hypothetical protein